MTGGGPSIYESLLNPQSFPSTGIKTTRFLQLVRVILRFVTLQIDFSQWNASRTIFIVLSYSLKIFVTCEKLSRDSHKNYEDLISSYSIR